MKKIFRFLLFVTVLFWHFSATGALPLDRIAAVVNNSVITENQLTKEINNAKHQIQQDNVPVPSDQELRQQVLNHLIDTNLQLQLAKNMQIKVDDAALKKAITSIAQRNNLTVEQLRDKLAEQGVSYEQYQKDIRQQLIINELQQREVGPRIVITDQEINDALNTVSSQAQNATEYQLEDILIPLSETSSTEQVDAAQKQANDLISKLNAGQSVDQQKLQINDLGWRKLSEVPEIFTSYVKSMKPGNIAGPIRTGNGIHVIKLIALRGESMKHTATQTHVRHILIKTSAITTDDQAKIRLINLRAAIVNGMDFANAAVENSQDPGSANKGGDLGWVNPEMLDPEFAKAMSQLQPGQISYPIHSQYGWHLIQVLGNRQIEDSKDFLRNQAREIIYNRKAAEAVQSWLQQLRSQAYIKITGEK